VAGLALLEWGITAFCCAGARKALFLFYIFFRNARQIRQRLPVPSMRMASARPDERGIGLGHLHDFRDLANSFASERWLNSLNVTFLRQPTRQTLRVTPRVRDCVITEPFGNLSSLTSSLGPCVADQRRSHHVLAGYFDCTRSTIAILDSFGSAEFANPRAAHVWQSNGLEHVPSAFASTALR
jgi:hypothetical protein